MEWNEWVALGLIAIGITGTITREIGRLVATQRETNFHLKAIKEDILQMRLNTIR